MSCGGWSAMTVDDWNRRFQEEYQLAMDRQGFLQKEESDRRFYKNLNEIRAYLGMPPVDYSCDSIGSGSTAIIDHGGQDEEKNCGVRPAKVEALIVQDSRSGQEYEASTVSKIQMEFPIVPDSTEIIDREEIEGQPFDFVEYLPEFTTDELEEFRQVEKIAIPTVEVEPPVVQDSSRIVDREYRVLSESVLGDLKAKLVDDNAVESTQSKKIPIPIEEMNQQIDIPTNLLVEGWKESSDSENEANIDEHQIRPKFHQVNSNPFEDMVYGSAVEGLKNLIVLLIEWMEIRLANSKEFSWVDLRLNSTDGLRNFSADKVFVKMSSHIESSSSRAIDIVKHRVQDGNVIFDPGISEICKGPSSFLKNHLKQETIMSTFEVGGFSAQQFKVVDSVVLVHYFEENGEFSDVGHIDPLLVKTRDRIHVHSDVFFEFN